MFSGSRAGIRTPIARTKTWSPAVRRPGIDGTTISDSSKPSKSVYYPYSSMNEYVPNKAIDTSLDRLREQIQAQAKIMIDQLELNNAIWQALDRFGIKERTTRISLFKQIKQSLITETKRVAQKRHREDTLLSQLKTEDNLKDAHAHERAQPRDTWDTASDNETTES